MIGRRMAQELSGKSVVVAGAGSGMGRAIAIAAARAGASVVLFGRRHEALDAVSQEIKHIGAVARAQVGDATDPADARGAVQHAVDSYGKLHALVNCVGTNIRERSLSELTPESWHDLIGNNLDAAFVLTQAALPAFREQGDGLLVHISSSAAKRPDQSGVGYQASKAGVAALAHATMEEERARGIRVSVIYPGLTATRLVEKRPTPLTAEELSKALQPEDVAHACLTVLSLPPRAYVPELLLYPTGA